ncbi:universal stress protein [Mycolicibacterium arenosum]|uniref:Universal stress protein n=1 Tax=Mycolicibacterium arenosum TaxID=2952157 RepID=A0ABT1LZE4_9MYCO|nr:universal stress protein [Mycolicibacterium sp. CAU 1645]MCP9270972.1 universal stress protein [Mycolicibacterium sp. CAU 1645]
MTGNPDTVVVGVDGSDSAIAAARWAGALAARFGLSLQVVHGVPRLGRNLTEAAAVFQAASMQYQSENADAFLKSAADAVRCEQRGLVVTTAASSDPIDDVLFEASKHARFIVLGGMDISPAAAVLLGSTTLKLTTEAICPVIVWRGDRTSPNSDAVVVGVDDTPAGRAALATGFVFAAQLGVALRAVHSWALRRPPGTTVLPTLMDWDAVEALQFVALTELVDEYHRDHRGVDVTCFLESGTAAGALLRHLEHAQLVVVGNRGRAALAAAALGSTSLNLLHHSPIPVVVCHPDPP